MTKDFLDKKDFKALTTFSFYSVLTSMNKENLDDKKNKIIFLTSFGYVSAESILSGEFDEKSITKENFSKYVSLSTTTDRNEIITERDNEELLDVNTSFVLENVEIRPFTGGVSTLPTMILFSDSILGLTSGDLDQ